MIRVALLILAALGLGSVAAVGTIYIQEQRTEDALAEYEPVLTLFTIEDIQAGTPLREAIDRGLVERRPFPGALLPDASVLEYGDLSQLSAATRDLTADSVVLEGDFEPRVRVGAGSILDLGFVAVSLALNEQQRGGGLVSEGSMVGVLSSQENPENNQVVTRVLFTSLEVVAIEGVAQDLGDISPSTASLEGIVSLAVPQNRVAELLEDYANGEITLVLLGQDQILPRFQD